MEEDRFRVSVCLQHYYNDQRSRAYVSVIPKNKVCWLQQRLRNLFSIEGRFYLHSRGHLLHPDEPLSLLRPDDPIEVVPLPEEVLEDGESKTKPNGMDCSQQRSSQPLQFEHRSKKMSIKEVQMKEVQMKEVQMKEVQMKEVPMKEVQMKEVLTKEVPILQEDIRDNKLLEMKQQALDLLEQFSDVNQHYVDETDGISVSTALTEVPKRRRRVRRRKRRTSNEESNNGDLLLPVESQTTEVPVATDETQNSALGPRKPRLIHSLSPS